MLLRTWKHNEYIMGVAIFSTLSTQFIKMATKKVNYIISKNGSESPKAVYTYSLEIATSLVCTNVMSIIHQ